MKTTHPDKGHYFDVWHVAKGVSKKLEAASKKKDCEDIRPWVKSVSNHCYWVASSGGYDGEKKLEKWKSISQDVTNKHEETNLYSGCEHGEIGERLWLKEGSRAHKLMREVAELPHLLADIPKLSPLHQTYSSEVYHSVVNNFAPKSTHFFYPAMTARLSISALHYDENGHRQQAITQAGEWCWKTCYPKGKKGENQVVKPVKTPVTFEYITALKEDLIQWRLNLISYRLAAADARTVIKHVPYITEGYEHVEKSLLVKQRRSRFSR